MENSREREEGTRLLLWMILLAIIGSSFSACGAVPGGLSDLGGQNENPPVGAGDGADYGYPEGSRIAAQVTVPLDVSHEGQGMVVDTIRVGSSGVLRTATTPIEINVGAISQLEIDDRDFYLPEAVSADLLSLGQLSISNYFENNLRVCGSSGRQKCSRLQIRMYTVAGEGEGLYNSADSYGLPIRAGLTLESAGTVGSGPEGSCLIQEVTIPASKNVLRLSDFGSVPAYQVAIDFSNAGIGNYAANLVIEALLVP
jgi:hypothetical protein